MPNFEKTHINYPDGALEFKNYIGNEYFMSDEFKYTRITKRNSFKDDRFNTINEFKDCIIRGGGVEFEWKGNCY